MPDNISDPLNFWSKSSVSGPAAVQVRPSDQLCVYSRCCAPAGPAAAALNVGRSDLVFYCCILLW